MNLEIRESELFSNLSTDSGGITLSDSFVKSDIAKIIRKMYSPRLSAPNNMVTDSAVESIDCAGDKLKINGLEGKQQKRFGFYFKPVTKHVAKTMMDSSTTSGSVSLPNIRCKRKRLTNVCKCCKRKMPNPARTNRARRCCGHYKVCNRNRCGDTGNSSCSGSVMNKVTRSERNFKQKTAEDEMVQINIGPGVRTQNKNQYSLTGRNGRVSTDVLHSCTRTKVNLNNSSLLDVQVVPEFGTNNEIKKSQRFLAQAVEKEEVKNISVFQRIMCTLFGKFKSSNPLEEPVRTRSSLKLKHLGSVEDVCAKNSVDLGKAIKPKSNQNLLAHLEQTDCKLSRDLNAQHKIGKSNTVNLEQNNILSQAQPTDKGSNLEKVIVHSSENNILGKTKANEVLIDKEECGSRKSVMINKEVEENLINIDNITPPKDGESKYDVASKGLRMEKDTDWAYEFWAGVFGACHSVLSFFTAFVLHLLTFVLQSLVQPLFCGTVRIGSEHFFKPCLSTAFDSVIQPVLMFLERSAGSLRDICLPVAQCCGFFCKEVSHVCKACRVVEIHKNYYKYSGHGNP